VRQKSKEFELDRKKVCKYKKIKIYTYFKFKKHFSLIFNKAMSIHPHIYPVALLVTICHLAEEKQAQIDRKK